MAKSRSQPVNLPGAQPLMNPLLFSLGQSSFNMTRGYEDIEGGGGDTRKGGSEKNVGLGGGALKICILQNQQEGRRAPKKLNC